MILASSVVVLVIMGGFNSSILYGTEHVSMKTQYIFGINENTNWWNCSWAYRKKITVNHSLVQETQQNFPLLIYASSNPDLAAHAKDDGSDIVFVHRFNNIVLDYQIEYFDGSTGKICAWVNVPYLMSYADTVVYMYYGNPNPPSLENPAGVWDSNYKAVYHLNETGTGTRWDSTSNDEDLSTEGYDGDEATDSGKVDGADDLDGSDDRLIKNCDDFNMGFTVSLWAKAGSTGQSVNSGLYSSYNSVTSATFQIDVDGLTPGSYRFRGGTSTLNNLKLSCSNIRC